MLADLTVDDKLGVPTSGSFANGDGSGRFDAPVDDAGNVKSLSVTTAAGTIELLKDTVYDADGLLRGGTDGIGRRIVFTDFNAFGQPQKRTSTLLGAAGKGLEAVTRQMSYDAWGRLLGTTDEETGSTEAWTYDSLGRQLTHSKAGTPDESWTYLYEADEDKLTVTETLASRREGASHVRVRVIEDGLLRSETTNVGREGSPWPRFYSYVNGRLDVLTDERGWDAKHFYDEAGRLNKVEVGGLTQVETTLDAEGRPIFIVDHLGRTTTIDYDALGRAVYRDFGDGDVEQALLDANGNPVSRSYGSDKKYSLSSMLDPLGRPKQVFGTGVLSKTEFDAEGRVLHREDGGSSGWWRTSGTRTFSDA